MIAPLRSRVFFSLAEVNEAMSPPLWRRLTGVSRSISARAAATCSSGLTVLRSRRFQRGRGHSRGGSRAALAATATFRLMAAIARFRTLCLGSVSGRGFRRGRWSFSGGASGWLRMSVCSSAAGFRRAAAICRAVTVSAMTGQRSGSAGLRATSARGLFVRRRASGRWRGYGAGDPRLPGDASS